QRVSLTMKLDAAPVARSDNHRSDRPRGGGGAKPSFQDRAAPAASGSAMASAFAKLQGIQKNKV
ncbi:MAG: hypothetical protein RLZZ470_1412, partial [Pseudomonadota bacterium]